MVLQRFIVRHVSRWVLVVLAVSVLANVLGAGLFMYRRHQQTDQRPGHYHATRASIFAGLAVPAGATVMLGDSLTDWCEWHELLGRGDVLNRGINHETVAAALDRLEPILAGQPAALVIMLGINDLLRGTPVERVAQDYARLVKHVRERSPGTGIVVQSVLPIRRELAGRGPDPATISALNTHLETLCREHACTYLSLFPLLAAADGELDHRFTYDGIHLSYEGYRVWRDALAPNL
jgi:lysophospholipase L1-like esterase